MPDSSRIPTHSHCMCVVGSAVGSAGAWGAAAAGGGSGRRRAGRAVCQLMVQWRQAWLSATATGEERARHVHACVMLDALGASSADHLRPRSRGCWRQQQYMYRSLRCASAPQRQLHSAVATASCRAGRPHRVSGATAVASSGQSTAAGRGWTPAESHVRPTALGGTEPPAGHRHPAGPSQRGPQRRLYRSPSRALSSGGPRATAWKCPARRRPAAWSRRRQGSGRRWRRPTGSCRRSPPARPLPPARWTSPSTTRGRFARGAGGGAGCAQAAVPPPRCRRPAQRMPGAVNPGRRHAAGGWTSRRRPSRPG